MVESCLPDSLSVGQSFILQEIIIMDIIMGPTTNQQTQACLIPTEQASVSHLQTNVEEEEVNSWVLVSEDREDPMDFPSDLHLVLVVSLKQHVEDKFM